MRCPSSRSSASSTASSRCRREIRAAPSYVRPRRSRSTSTRTATRSPTWRRAPSARTASTSSSRSPAACARRYAWPRRHGRSGSASCSAAWWSRASASRPAAHIASLCDHVDLDGNLLLRDDPWPGVRFVDGVQLPFEQPGLGVSEKQTSIYDNSPRASPATRTTERRRGASSRTRRIRRWPSSIRRGRGRR